VTTDLREMNPSALAQPAAPAPRHELRARVLVANGRHNAFPTIARFDGADWIAYREGDDHAGPARIVVLRSTDGHDWQTVRSIALMADNRDPQLLVHRGRLCLFVIGVESKAKRTVLFTAQPGQRDFTEQGEADLGNLALWRPIEHAGQLWCAAYAAGGERRLALIRSDDGLDWQQVAALGEPHDRHGLWSETAIVVAPGGRMTAALRFKWSPRRPEHPCLGEIWHSDPPYRQWHVTATLPFRLEGPALATFAGSTYLFTRGFNALGSACAMDIHRLDPDTGATHPHASIPTMRDCAYGQAVLSDPDTLRLVFYSTAPDGVNLYLADVPLGPR
jgi:hypothetical protein